MKSLLDKEASVTGLSYAATPDGRIEGVMSIRVKDTSREDRDVLDKSLSGEKLKVRIVIEET